MLLQGARSDELILLGSGTVKIVSGAESGRQAMLALRGPGDLIGEFAVFDGRPRSASVVALGAVSGWVVGSDRLHAHLGATPAAALAVLRMLVSRLREADLRRLEFGSLDTVARLASLLCTLGEQHGAGSWIRLTQAELGAATGASREATVRAVTRLRAAGLVETARHRIRILRPVDLARVARGEGVPDEGGHGAG
ncbi:hypothetical protein AFB00_23400 [Pseudonocardia sp. HH130630-07]|nr:hypothetical protein AFB00_23400 [Pseudonocardia sp. HH130630-07]